MKIEWLISGTVPEWIEDNYQNGGYVYDTYVRKILRKKHDVKITFLFRGNSSNFIIKIIKFIRYIFRSRFVQLQGEIVVRDIFSTVFSPFNKKRKHVIILHHLDISNFQPKWFFHYFEKSFFKRIKFADIVITVSDHWRQRLIDAGCKNVITIYNSFDLAQFEFKDQDLELFRKSLGFSPDKPLIYLGNARPEKGFQEVADILHGINAELVVTGKGEIKGNLRLLFLPYNDYLKLLKISSLVITMSRFSEGWNRVAHEAMLCGTPVIGSGRGGMKELLERGRQLICPDIAELKDMIVSLLNDEVKMKQMSIAGRSFAKQFDLAYFEKSWNNAIDSLKSKEK